MYQSGVNVLFGAVSLSYCKSASEVYLAQGAASGAFVGGAIADRFGWRMAFWIQLAPILVATFLVITQVHVPHEKDESSAWEKLAKIDWLGSFVLMVSVGIIPHFLASC